MCEKGHCISNCLAFTLGRYKKRLTDGDGIFSRQLTYINMYIAGFFSFAHSVTFLQLKLFKNPGHSLIFFVLRLGGRVIRVSVRVSRDVASGAWFFNLQSPKVQSFKTLFNSRKVQRQPAVSGRGPELEVPCSSMVITTLALLYLYESVRHLLYYVADGATPYQSFRGCHS